jgi:hypothetical protein
VRRTDRATLMSAAETLQSFDEPSDIRRTEDLAEVVAALTTCARQMTAGPGRDTQVVRSVHAAIGELTTARQAQRTHRHLLLRPLAQARFAHSLGAARAHLHRATATDGARHG